MVSLLKRYPQYLGILCPQHILIPNIRFRKNGMLLSGFPAKTEYWLFPMHIVVKPFESSVPARQPNGSRIFMNTEYDDELNDELRDEYAFSQMTGGVRGKYAKQYHEWVKFIMLEPDVAKIFPDAKSVNEALRALSKIIQQYQKAANLAFQPIAYRRASRLRKGGWRLSFSVRRKCGECYWVDWVKKRTRTKRRKKHFLQGNRPGCRQMSVLGTCCGVGMFRRD